MCNNTRASTAVRILLLPLYWATCRTIQRCRSYRQFRHTTKTVDRNRKNTGKSRGSGTAVSCSNPSNRWRTVSLEFSVSFQLSETIPGTSSCPMGDDFRLVTVVDVAPRGDPKVSAPGLFETLFFVCAGLTVRVQRGDGGSFTVGWWEMFVVQHSNPSRPPEPLAALLRGHEGGIKDTQMLQLYH